MISQKTLTKIIENECYHVMYLYKRATEHAAMSHATRIWNLIDRLPNPEPFWAIMLDLIPDAFSDDSNPNSLFFTYRMKK